MGRMVRFLPTETLTVDTVSSDLNRFLELIHTNPEAEIVFDLTHVLQCDTAGLALLIEAKRLCALQQSKLKVANMPDETLKLATFCGLEHLFLGDLVDG